MTYTIIGRCSRTGQLGIGITTWSLAVGGYCPFVKSNFAALSAQAAADPRLGRLAMRLLELGYSPAKVIEELSGHDPHFEYRQVGIVDKEGTAAVHTGARTRPWTGHMTGGGYVAMGNTIDSERVVQAIARAFEENEDLDLDERLLTSLEAGRDAGGQRAAHPEPANQDRSAALIVHELEEYALMDLRVDAHPTAVQELRRVRDEYKPYIPLYYHLRVKEPDKVPAQAVWFAQQQEQAHPQADVDARGLRVKGPG